MYMCTQQFDSSSEIYVCDVIIFYVYNRRVEHTWGEGMWCQEKKNYIYMRRKNCLTKLTRGGACARFLIFRWFFDFFTPISARKSKNLGWKLKISGFDGSNESERLKMEENGKQNGYLSKFPRGGDSCRGQLWYLFERIHTL